MKINECRFVISAVSPAQYPADERPEIALAGRSNVGKSSLTNMLINRKGLAKTSSTPGKTQTINFYDIGGEFRFVDLPGYGYAKVSKSQRGTWGKIIETYLKGRPNLLEVFLLVDLRHKPTEDDILMYQWIKSFGFRGIVVATKSDKIKRSQLNSYKKIIRDTLEMAPEDKLFCVSAESRDGKYVMWDFINGLFEEKDIPIYFERQVGEPNVEKAASIKRRGAELAKERDKLMKERILQDKISNPDEVIRPFVDPELAHHRPFEVIEPEEEEAVEDAFESDEDSMSIRSSISSQLRLPKGAKKRKV